jgi:glycosyltransferase involved in cell wall biosynthesis
MGIAHEATMTSNASAHERDSTPQPRVSVIAAFLNGEQFLAEAIESVITQSFDSWEFLLVDDGSGPAATAIAKEYATRYSNKIRYLEHPRHINRGVCATRNLGIQHARGEYIAFIDADDFWLPSKLVDQVAILDAYPEVGMVCGAVIYWNSWSSGKDIVHPTGHKQNVVVPPPEAALALWPLGGAYAPCPSDIILRTNLVRAIGGFEEDFTAQNQMYEDQAFLIKLYLASPVYFSSSIWLKYREHPDSCVATVNKAGKHHEVRKYFLDWLEGYLTAIPQVDPRLTRSLQHALRYYRNPRIHYLLTMPGRLWNRYNYLRTQLDALLNRVL